MVRKKRGSHNRKAKSSWVLSKQQRHTSKPDLLYSRSGVWGRCAFRGNSWPKQNFPCMKLKISPHPLALSIYHGERRIESLEAALLHVRARLVVTTQYHFCPCKTLAMDLKHTNNPPFSTGLRGACNAALRRTYHPICWPDHGTEQALQNPQGCIYTLKRLSRVLHGWLSIEIYCDIKDNPKD